MYIDNSIIQRGNSGGKQKDISVTKNGTSADMNQPIIHIDQPEINNGHQSSEWLHPMSLLKDSLHVHLVEHGGQLHVDEKISQQEPDLMKQASNPGDQIENGNIESRGKQDRHKTTNGKIKF